MNKEEFNNFIQTVSTNSLNDVHIVRDMLITHHNYYAVVSCRVCWSVAEEIQRRNKSHIRAHGDAGCSLSPYQCTRFVGNKKALPKSEVDKLEDSLSGYTFSDSFISQYVVVSDEQYEKLDKFVTTYHIDNIPALRQFISTIDEVKFNS